MLLSAGSVQLTNEISLMKAKIRPIVDWFEFVMESHFAQNAV